MKTFLLLPLVSCLLPLAGCSEDTSTPSAADQPGLSSAPAVDGSKFLLTAEPDGAADVIKVREDAADGEDVVIVGRIGGSSNPWIEDRAAFSIVDGSLKACSDIEGDGCPMPWDYCCETQKLPTATALVKVVDEDGELVKADARELLSVKELSTVIVKGKAQRDDAGNLTILATGVFVQKK